MRWILTASVLAVALALTTPVLASENSELKVFDENTGTYGTQPLNIEPPAVVPVVPPAIPLQTTKVGGDVDVRR